MIFFFWVTIHEKSLYPQEPLTDNNNFTVDGSRHTPVIDCIAYFFNMQSFFVLLIGSINRLKLLLYYTMTMDKYLIRVQHEGIFFTCLLRQVKKKKKKSKVNFYWPLNYLFIFFRKNIGKKSLKTMGRKAMENHVKKYQKHF